MMLFLFINLIKLLVYGFHGKNVSVSGELISNNANNSLPYYTAATVEYRPLSFSETNNVTKILQENTRTIISLMQQAKAQNADIIVFPEYGLTGENMNEENYTQFRELTQIIPNSDDKIIPCFENNTSNTFSALQMLSCATLSNRIYAVINLAERVPENETTSEIFYNTQVVLDRSGAVIAKYRKKHLFFEKYFQPGTEDSTTAIFATDFGVNFSLQICFDIMYEEPGLKNILDSGVKDIAMSTFWIDELPFLTAPQIFSGWAHGLGINLLVSNYHIPEKGGMGYGIFPGNTKKPFDYEYNVDNKRLLTVTNVTSNTPTDTEGTNNIPRKKLPEEGGTYHYIIHEDLSNYTYVKLAQTVKFSKKRLCHGSFCCTANYSLNSRDFQFNLFAYRGYVGKGAGKYQMLVETCAVVLCLNDDVTSCANINQPTILTTQIQLDSISGTFTTPFVYPSIFTTDFHLVKWSDFLIYEKDQLKTMKIQRPVENLLTASLFGRIYDNL